ncbi:ABC transporter ATP-binding protein [bacterium]|nr:ABC transporter ATP-binding protein [bacterium]
MISVKNLSKKFENNHVLKGVSLDIGENEIFVVLGGSGSGKSVLIKHIMGLMRPDSGEIFVDGVDITRCSSKEMLPIRKKFGMLFQYSALFDSMSVKDNIAFPLREHTSTKEKDITRIVAEKLSLVGLSGIEGMFPADLSGGMRKRVALARAIVLEPSVIVYDEPTSGLDPLMARTVDDLIVETQNKLKITSIIISHDIPSAFRIADRIAIIYKGEIVAYGKPDDIKKSKHEYVVDFLKTGLHL